MITKISSKLNSLLHLNYQIQKKGIYNLNLLSNKIKYQFSTHAPPPSKLPKATQKFIYFNVKNIYGKWEKIPAIVGQPVLESITRMRVQKYPNDLCFGHDHIYPPHQRPHDPFSDGPACGKCRIQLHDNWFNKVMKQTDGYATREQQLLHINAQVRSNQRLACCIPVQQWMDGMTFSISPIPLYGGQPQLA